MIRFNFAYIKMNTKTEGPYNRCCIWFQGCNIRCPECCNKSLQELTLNHIISLEQLIEIVKQAQTEFKIEGITLTGGEPSIQTGLRQFNNEIRKLGLGIIMFSGKYKEEINPDLVASVDLLIDGPFINKDIDNQRLLIGSKNKKLTLVTDRYKNDLYYFDTDVALEEISVEEEYVFVNGD